MLKKKLKTIKIKTLKIKKPIIEYNINDMPLDNHSELSKIITSKLSIKDKKADGIYFTPREIIYKILKIIKEQQLPIKNILL